MTPELKDKSTSEEKALSFLEEHKNSLNPPLDNIENMIANTKEKGDFILLLDNEDKVIAYLGYHIYKNFIQGKYNLIFIDLLLIDEDFRKNFLILNKLRLEFAKIIKKNKIKGIQTEAYNNSKHLIKMYSKLAYKQKQKTQENKTLFFIKPEKFL